MKSQPLMNVGQDGRHVSDVQERKKNANCFSQFYNSLTARDFRELNKKFEKRPMIKRKYCQFRRDKEGVNKEEIQTTTKAIF